MASPPRPAPPDHSLGGDPGPLRLLGVDRWAPASRAAAGVGLVALGVALAWTTYALEVAFRARLARGQSLSAWQNVFRLGAPWPPLVPLGAAAVLLALGWWRLRHAGPEPSHGLGRRSLREWTAGEVRRHLRRERGLVRVGFAVLTVIVVLVVMRLGVYGALALAGRPVAIATLPGVVAEVVVSAAGWIAGRAWIAAYLERLTQWGVADG